MYDLKPNNGDILEPLEEGDFFVVQRSNRFYSIDAIGNLNIALKVNEIIDFSDKSVKKISDYFIKNLTSIIPQKNYSAIYAKEGFYIFLKKLTDGDAEKHKRHYETIEKIFSFVAKEFVSRGEQNFVKLFCSAESSVDDEINSKVDMCKKFKDAYGK